MSKKIEFKIGDVDVKAYFNPYTNKKNKALKGFVSFNISTDGEFLKAYNGLQVVDGKGGVFLSEPSRPYEDKDGETKYSPHYIVALKEKEALTEGLLKHIEKDIA